MNIDYHFSEGQIQGARNYQEDNYEILQQVDIAGAAGVLFILCDGMGGHAGGAVASELICKHFREAFDHSTLAIPERLSFSLDQAHQQLIAYTTDNIEHAGMGTTLIAACVVGQELYWLSVGDSPLWLLREGELLRLNADHSMMPVFLKMVEMGEFTLEEALEDPKRHALRSVVNSKKTKEIDLSETAFSLQNGDQLILASDGLETLSGAQIIAELEKSASCEQAVTELLAAVDIIAKPEQDNTSVIVHRVIASIRPAKTVPLVSNQAKKKPKSLLLSLGQGLALIGTAALATYFVSTRFMPVDIPTVDKKVVKPFKSDKSSPPIVFHHQNIPLFNLPEVDNKPFAEQVQPLEKG